MRRGPLILAVAVSLLAALTVQSATKPTTALKVPSGMSLELKVNGKAVPVPPGREVPVAAGTYAPASLTCGAMTPAGKGRAELWTIKCAGPNWGKIKEIEVQEGATTTLDAGPPFTMKTTIYRTEDKGGAKIIPLTLHIFGKAGELYDYNTLKKGQSTAPQMTLQIVDEQGNVLATGSLPFG